MYNQINEINEKNDNFDVIVDQKIAFERVFRSEDGEKILTVIANQCLPNLGQFESDTHKMAFDQGKLNVFILMLKLANIQMESFLKKYQILQSTQV